MSCSYDATPRWVSPLEPCSTAPAGSPSSPPSRRGRPCPPTTSTRWSSTSPYPAASRPSTSSDPASTAASSWSSSQPTTRPPSRPTGGARSSSARSRLLSCGTWLRLIRRRAGRGRGVAPGRSRRTLLPRSNHRRLPRSGRALPSRSHGSLLPGSRQVPPQEGRLAAPRRSRLTGPARRRHGLPPLTADRVPLGRPRRKTLASLPPASVPARRPPGTVQPRHHPPGTDRPRLRREWMMPGPRNRA